jgi:alkyl sulfatase BDS1-like metallo-beta-lactamase superfamily hydrolase
MATAEQCEQALTTRARRLAAADPAARRRNSLDRSLSCALPDLGIIFAGRLQDGMLTGVHRVDDPAAQIRLAMTSDDLVALVAGELSMASAWASGRVKIDAGMLDLVRLRTVF